MCVCRRKRESVPVCKRERESARARVWGGGSEREFVCGSVKLIGLGIDSDEVGAFYSHRFGMMWFVHDEGDDIHHGIALSDFNSCEKAVQWHCNLLTAVRCVGWAVI